TTHDFLFGAVAELIDNSRDAGATRLDIYTVDRDNMQGGFLLCFLDDGCGMTPREATDIVYFGRSSKTANPKMIGRFGNGLKSGSMRIGKDFILFTKKENTMTCLLFSQTFCETEGLTEVVVPLPTWSAHTKNPIIDDSEKFATQLSIICKYSPFKSEAELMKQFDGIYGKTGTLLVIYNLKLSVTGEAELDNQTDEADLLIAGAPENLPEQRSLRAYTAILYFDPRMRIFIQAQKVETKRLPYCFYRPRMYPYISSSFRQVAMKKLEETEMEVKAAEEAVKKAKCALKHMQDSHLYKDNESAQRALGDALENEKRMREKLEDRRRNLRRQKKLFLIFGINIQNRSQYGMLIYSNSRLIRMFEKVGPQKNIESCVGAGAVGIVDIPTDVMEPTHNKQAFANVKEYNCLLKAMGNCLAQYWKDIGISQKGETIFWSDFGYLSNKWCERPSEILRYKRRRAVEIPDIVQCDICLKWRLVSLDSDINHGGHHGIWNCEKSPNSRENKCSTPEHLPSIPFGTFNPTLSLNHRQKELIDSIQEHKKKLENIQSQKLHVITPHTIVPCIVGTRAPQETACQRKTFHKDPSPACRRLIKRRRKRRLIQQGSHEILPPAKGPRKVRQTPSQEEKHFLSVPEERKDHSFPKVLCLEEQDEQPYSEEPGVIKIETDSEAEIICIISSESESGDLPMSEECKEFSFIHKDKQEPSEEKRDSLFSLLSCGEKSFTELETSQEDCQGQVLVAAQTSKATDSQAEKCEHVPETKVIETLTSHIKEILLYFLPEHSISREQLVSMGPEDILLMFKASGDLLKGHLEENKKNTLCIRQLFLQYEQHICQKIQSIQHRGLQVVHALETELSLCELQIKATQEKLGHFRGKAAQLLLKIHPHLLIRNLEDVDCFLEESLKPGKEHMPECPSASGINDLPC
ncbi:hypothetical protein JRQ81_019881, partial [Phrynocephalus forsythii]